MAIKLGGGGLGLNGQANKKKNFFCGFQKAKPNSCRHIRNFLTPPPARTSKTGVFADTDKNVGFLKSFFDTYINRFRMLNIHRKKNLFSCTQGVDAAPPPLHGHIRNYQVFFTLSLSQFEVMDKKPRWVESVVKN